MDTYLCELAVQFALRRFQKRRCALYADMEEWRTECRQIAWCAVLQYAAESGLTDSEACSQCAHPSLQLWDSIEAQKREWVHHAAHEALKALERFWYSEKNYQRRFVRLSDLSNSSEGDTEETHLQEELADFESFHSIIAHIDHQLLLNSLRQRVSDSDWTIVVQLLEGHSQKEIAQMLGITPSAVCQRLHTIAKKCAEIREEIGLNP